MSDLREKLVLALNSVALATEYRFPEMTLTERDYERERILDKIMPIIQQELDAAVAAFKQDVLDALECECPVATSNAPHHSAECVWGTVSHLPANDSALHAHDAALRKEVLEEIRERTKIKRGADPQLSSAGALMDAVFDMEREAIRALAKE